LVVTSTIPVCTSFVHSRLMLAEGRSGIVAVVTVVAALTNIGLNLVLVPHIGINGSALATLITYTALAVGMASVSRLWLRLPRPPLLLWVQLAATIAVIFATRSISTHGTGAVIRLIGVAIAAGATIQIIRRLQKSGADEAREAAASDGAA